MSQRNSGFRDLLEEKGRFFVDERVAEQYLSGAAGAQIIQKRKELLEQAPEEGLWRLAMMRENCSRVFLSSSLLGFRLPTSFRSLSIFVLCATNFEFVGKVGERFVYNDSKATTPEASLASVRSVEAPVTLLAGGLDKGLSFSIWKEGFRGKVDRVIAFGAAAEKIRAEVGDEIETLCVETLTSFGFSMFCGEGESTPRSWMCELGSI